MGTHRDQLCGIDSESAGEQADGEAATNAMDGKRGAPIAANADRSVEWGVGGDVPALVPKVSTRNGGNARGTQAGRMTPWFLVLSSARLAHARSTVVESKSTSVESTSDQPDQNGSCKTDILPPFAVDDWS
jgi:hypothetical protein